MVLTIDAPNTGIVPHVPERQAAIFRFAYRQETYHTPVLHPEGFGNADAATRWLFR